MQEITLNSREVAVMVGKKHKELLRDIRRHAEQMDEANKKAFEEGAEPERKIAPGDFFKESSYMDANNQGRPCYQVTKKGCEFIAHKLTGAKGTEFTVRYINRFHEMEDALKKEQEKPKRPWFIRDFRGGYIMLFRDFETITGVHLSGNYTSLKRTYRLEGGLDYNGWGWKNDKEKFKQEYGFDYGDDDCMMYLYLCGIWKALRIFEEEGGGSAKQDACRIIMDGLKSLELGRKRKTRETRPAISVNDADRKDVPVQISIITGTDAVITVRK